MRSFNRHCRVPGCTENHMFHFCRNCYESDSDHLSSLCPRNATIAVTGLFSSVKSRCRAPGCNENHSYHYCRQCFNKDSNHLSSKCPESAFLNTRTHSTGFSQGSSFAHRSTLRHCRVAGCTEDHSAHYCKLCLDMDSDHFMSKCPSSVASKNKTNGLSSPSETSSRTRAGSFDRAWSYPASRLSNFEESVKSNTEPVGSLFKSGDCVSVKYSGDLFLGKVISTNTNGLYDIRFDNGFKKYNARPEDMQLSKKSMESDTEPVESSFMSDDAVSARYAGRPTSGRSMERDTEPVESSFMPDDAVSTRYAGRPTSGRAHNAEVCPQCNSTFSKLEDLIAHCETNHAAPIEKYDQSSSLETADTDLERLSASSSWEQTPVQTDRISSSANLPANRGRNTEWNLASSRSARNYAREENMSDKEPELATNQSRLFRSSSAAPVNRKGRHQEFGSRSQTIQLASCLNPKWSFVEPILQQIASPLNGVKLSEIFAQINVMNIRCLQSLVFDMSTQEQKYFHTKLIPFIAETALQVSTLFRDPMSLLIQSRSGEVELSQKQLCCLLSLAFFDALPQPSGTDTRKLSFSYLLANEKEKLRCIIQYFRTMQQRAEQRPSHWGQRKVKFIRKVAELNADQLSDSKKLLSKLTVNDRGKIEDASGFLQADFSNQYIGGGVLGKGSVQEEIRFIIYPECIVSILLCEKMLPNEAIVIVGAERFCQYSGYAASFCFLGPFNDDTADVNGVLDSQLVAFDASEVKDNPRLQYTERILMRDFGKLYVALCADTLVDGSQNRTLKSFATGNWGCGAFGGDAQLKFLMQWIMASFCNREMIFYSCNDRRLENLRMITLLLQNKGINIGQLFCWIVEFTKLVQQGNILLRNDGVFKFLRKML